MADSPAQQLPPSSGPVLETQMVGSLRRMTSEVTVGSLVGRAFEVWWRNLLRLIALSLIPFAALMAGFLAFYLGFARSTASQPAPPSFAFVAVAMVLFVPVAAIYVGGIAHGALQHLRGQPVRVGGMLRAGARRVWPLVAAGIMAYLAMLVGFLLLVVPGIIVALGFSPMPAVAVAEKLGPVEVLRRSWRLTRGARGTIFLAGLVLWALLSVIGLGAGFFGQVAPQPAQQLVSLVVQLLFTPLFYVLPSVIYHDLRIAKEGVATEDVAGVFE